MRVFLWIGSPAVLSLVFWSAFIACIDAPLPEVPPAARVVVAWDPLACGDPHRVVVELEHDEGTMLAASTRCATGMLALDAPHYGLYRGRLYAWQLEDEVEIRSQMAFHMAIDQPIVRWWVVAPP